jgi:Rho-type GTPase-activating protein 1/2
MLSTLPTPQHDMSNLHYNTRQAGADANLENRLCPGCKRSAVTEDGGLVVAFGSVIVSPYSPEISLLNTKLSSSFFHVDCFKCAKCGDHVTADTNLLLLSDGSPICANCSYSCNVCHQPILDEAIMTGDDSYHAHCFKCKVCKNRIDELVFAKTSQGIYCMNCHNDRMAKIRRHAQKKAERERLEKEKAAGASRNNVCVFPTVVCFYRF